ncbi:hypothetical protein ACFLU5_17135 [Bacteroidota bacterium]
MTHRLFPVLFIIMLFACDSTESEVEPIHPLIGTWDQTSTASCPVGEDPTIFEDWIMIFGEEGEFTSIDCPYMTTNDRSTWASFGDQHSNITLKNVDGGISSFQISGFADSIMTVSFMCISPLDGRTQQNIIAENVTPVCVFNGNYIVDFAKR